MDDDRWSDYELAGILFVELFCILFAAIVLVRLVL